MASRDAAALTYSTASEMSADNLHLRRNFTFCATLAGWWQMAKTCFHFTCCSFHELRSWIAESNQPHNWEHAT